MDKPNNSNRLMPAIPFLAKKEIVEMGRSKANSARAANAGVIFFSNAAVMVSPS
jgi:hypothetical protein